MAGATIYRYRPHVTWGLYIILAVFGFQLLVAFVILAIILSTSEIGAPATLVLLYIALVASFAALGFLLRRFIYRMAGVRIRVEDGKLWYERRNGTAIVPLDAIERLEFPSIRYSGGWLKVVSSNETLQIMLVLQGIGNLLMELKEAMDRLGLQDRYDRRKFFNFYKTAVFSDQSLDRQCAIFWKWISATIALAVPEIVLAHRTPFAIVGVVLWPLGCWILVTGACFLPELLFGLRVAQLSDEQTFTCPPRDRQYEKSVYRKAFAIAALIYIAVVILSASVGWSL